MTNFLDLDLSKEPKHVLVYGGPKTGKTELALRLSEHFKIIYLGFEKGHLVAAKFPQEWKKNIEIIDIPDTRLNPRAMAVMTHLTKNGYVNPCVEHGVHKCPSCLKDKKPFDEIDAKKIGPDTIFVLDSLTQWTNSIMAHIGKDQPETWKPEWNDWRNQGSFLDMGLSFFQQARFNLICITHEGIVETGDGKERLVPLAGSSNFSRNTAKYFDTVVYCELKNNKHTFASKTTYANNVVTGDRLGVDVQKVEGLSEGSSVLMRIFRPTAG